MFWYFQELLLTMILYFKMQMYIDGDMPAIIKPSPFSKMLLSHCITLHPLENKQQESEGDRGGTFKHYSLSRLGYDSVSCQWMKKTELEVVLLRTRRAMVCKAHRGAAVLQSSSGGKILNASALTGKGGIRDRSAPPPSHGQNPLQLPLLPIQIKERSQLAVCPLSLTLSCSERSKSLGKIMHSS